MAGQPLPSSHIPRLLVPSCHLISPGISIPSPAPALRRAMLLYTVQFLCSVAAVLARLVRVLRKAMASVLLASSSPLAAASGGGVSSASPTARRVAQFPAWAPAVAAVLAAPCDGGGGEQLQGGEAKKKKAAWAARRRPSRLLIPAAAEACEAALFGDAAAAAAEEEAEVEVEGEGFWLASRRGSRHAMEDGYGVITRDHSGDSQLAFYGVYDGHGGRAAVDLVSSRLGSNVVAAVLAAEARKKPLPGTREAAAEVATTSTSPDAVAAAIRAAYLATDGEVLSQGVRGGSCAATALVKGGDLYMANLGDCRAVMSRDGAATALTSDHTAAREDERARIESLGGYVSCGGGGVWRVQDCLAVSRAFGDGGLKRWVISEPETSRTRLTAGCEFLVIASDGLWNKVSNQEAVDAVSRRCGGGGSGGAGCCRELVDMARGRGSRDDITVMVVDLKRFLQ